MHKNQIWLAFLGTIALGVLWFTLVSTYDLYFYFALDAKTSPLRTEWSVQGKSIDRYFLLAKYAFTANGDLHEGETAFESTYKNILAGEQAMQIEKRKEWNVFYSARDPNISTLQKLFPWKSCIYSGILWGLLLYFVWLGFYVGKVRNQPHDKEWGNGTHHT